MPRKLDGTFIESGTITVTQLSGTLNETSNAAYNQANNAYAQANAARSSSNTTFATVNTTFGTINTSLGTVNTTFGTVNTAVTNAHDQANSARGQANTAYGQANAAYGAANTRLSTSGGSISGDLSITGNLTVQGNATTINVSNLSVNDSMILLSTNAVGDSNDIGFIGHFDRGATATHAGLIRKATQNQFYLFDNYEVEPTNNVIDVTGNNFRVGNLRLGIINANSFVTSAGLNVTDQANSAFAAANNRVLKAGDTMTGQLNVSSGGLIVQASDNETIAFIRSPSRTLRITPFFNSEGTNRGTWLEAINTANASYNKLTLTGTDVILDARANVGIGITSPAAKLDVGGAINSNGSITVIGGSGARVILDTAGDIYAYRTGGTTGVIFLGNSGTRYLYYDGTNYNMPNGQLYVNGQLVLNLGNYTSYVLSNVVDGWRTTNDGFHRFYFVNAGRSYYKSPNGHEFRKNTGDALTAVIDDSGNFSAIGNITAYSSDKRLKTNIQNIPNALDKILSLNGVTFDWIDRVQELGFTPDTMVNDAGVIAQEVQKVLPQAVKPAPFDREWDKVENKSSSKSGEDFITVQYEKLVPLLIEAIKELKAEIDELKKNN